MHTVYRLAGGEESAVAAERSMLSAAGVDVTVWDQRNATFAERYGWSQTAVKTVWNASTARDLASFLRANEPFDVAHVHNTFPAMSPSIFATLKSFGVPVVRTLHNYRLSCVNALHMRANRPCFQCLGTPFPAAGIRFACYDDSPAKASVVALLSSAEKLLRVSTRWVDRVIALSRFSQTIFERAGIPRHHIVVSPNTVAFEPTDTSTLSGSYVFIGRLSPEKGVDLLLQTWKRLPNPPSLRIIGDGPLADDVRAAHGTSNITWVGTLQKNEVMRELLNARALVAPSAALENCPMTVLEASAAGVPSIVPKHGAMEEMIDDGRTGWHVEPGSRESLAAAVMQRTADDQVVRAAGRAARTKYGTLWSRSVASKRLLALYHELIDDRHEALPHA